MTEASEVYQNDISGLKQWIKKPGRKHLDYPVMTGFPQFTDKQLTDVANYVLEEEWN